MPATIWIACLILVMGRISLPVESPDPATESGLFLSPALADV